MEADESPVVEVPEANIEETPETVEFDHVSDVGGDVTPNPVLETDEETEEVDDTETTDETTDDDAESGDATDEATTADETQTTDDTALTQNLVDKPVETKDPGDFQPARDYGFEITTTDGKTVKITTPEEADKFAERLDDNPELISASQFTKFNRSVSKMDAGLDRERQDYDAQKKEFETNQAAEAERTQQVQSWTNELKYLEAKGMIPKIESSKDADWLGNSEDEAVKARMEIVNWMDAENKARDTAGIGKVTSMVDAFRMMQAEQAQSTVQAERTAAADKRRAKGSMVSGSSPHIPSNTPKNTIVGAGGNLRDLIYEAQMGQ